MNKDENIKEYVSYAVKLGVKFADDQERELNQVVIAEDGYKAEEIAIEWVLSHATWNVKEILYSECVKNKPVLTTNKDVREPDGTFFMCARGSCKTDPIIKALQAAAEIPEDIFCNLALKARDLDKSSPIYNMILDEAKEWGVGIIDSEVK